MRDAYERITPSKRGGIDARGETCNLFDRLRWKSPKGRYRDALPDNPSLVCRAEGITRSP